VCEADESRAQGGAKAKGEHKIEELVHMFGESLADGGSQHADAVEDGILRWRILSTGAVSSQWRNRFIKTASSPSGHEAFLDASEDRVEIRSHA
jgi:hypothetical protein